MSYKNNEGYPDPTAGKTLPAALNELNSKAVRNVGNIKRVSFRSGQNGIKNIYIDIYDNSQACF